MEKRIEAQNESLIDLGAVATETRGSELTGVQDDPNIPFQCKKAGLSAE